MTFESFVANRYSQFKFPGKPSEAIRRCLKGHGYRWNPRSGVWYRHAASGYADAVQGVRSLLERETGAAVVHVEAKANSPDAFDLAFEDDCARQCGL